MRLSKRTYELVLELWLVDALRQLQELGLLQRYRGSYDIVERSGKRFLVIQDEQDSVGLVDLLGAFNAGVEQGKKS